MGQRKRAAPYDGRKPVNWEESSGSMPRRMNWHLVMGKLGRGMAARDGRRDGDDKTPLPAPRRVRCS
jgi:hypothetical protein